MPEPVLLQAQGPELQEPKLRQVPEPERLPELRLEPELLQEPERLRELQPVRVQPARRRRQRWQQLFRRRPSRLRRP